MYIHYRTLFITGCLNIITVNKIPWDGFDSAKRDNALQIISYYVTPFFTNNPFFDPRPKNCLSFSKKSPRKIVYQFFSR